ncbi:MAG: methyl-accepting chemotaxis protein [Oligoflexia bacterium]|nr:methyl-accepting chemotaxis protein [Oligoflexia bacterium]
MKDLTIGKKILFGFLTLLGLLVLVSLISIVYINKGTNNFIDYRSAARNTNITGRIQTNILMARLNVKDFIITGSEEESKQVKEYLQKVRTMVDEAYKETTDPADVAILKDIDKDLETYNKDFDKVTSVRVKADALFKDVLNTKGPAMEKELRLIMGSARTDKDTNAAAAAGETTSAIDQMRIAVLKFYQDASDQLAEVATKEMAASEKQIAELDKVIQNKDRRESWGRLSENFNVYKTTYPEFKQLMLEQTKLINDSLNKVGSRIADQSEKLKLNNMEQQNKLGPQILSDNKTAQIIVIIVSLISIAMGIFLALTISSGLSKVLNRITNSLSESSSQVASASEQLSGASQQLSSASSEQASSIEETSASLEEMSGMIENNLRNAEKAKELAGSVRSMAESGNQSMNELINSMTEILESNGKIEELVKVIGEIGEKTKIIDEIVFQTKLLSFNASVEAERAGEHGRGFAVVAQEVGNLAQMSGKAALEISSIVKDSIKNAETITTENKKRVEKGNNYVKETAKILKETVSNSEMVATSSAQVVNASREQTSGIKQITQAMEQLNKATQENASISEESASSSEELAAQADNLRTYVDELNKMVNGDKASGVNVNSNVVNHTSHMSHVNNVNHINQTNHSLAPATRNQGNVINFKQNPKKKEKQVVHSMPLKKEVGGEENIIMNAPNPSSNDDWERL